MKLAELRRHWTALGKTDPFWAILTTPTKHSNKWDQTAFYQTGCDEANETLTYLRGLPISFSNQRMLDFGCGVGRVTQGFARVFTECYGVDIASSMIKLARKYNNHGRRCSYLLNTKPNLSLFRNSFFDLVYSNLVLQHMEPQYSLNYIAEFLRVTKPGGVIIFQLPTTIKGYCISQMNPFEALNDNAYDAEFEIRSPLDDMMPQSKSLITVKVTNRSSCIWPRDAGIFLGNHWKNRRGEVLIQDDARAPLARCVKPQESCVIPLLVTAPSTPGSYLLECDMVLEGVGWFKDKAPNPEAVAPIQVKYSSMWQHLCHSLCHSLFSSITPRMEMYGMSEELVTRHIVQNGGRILDVRQDESAASWHGLRYCVTREQVNPDDNLVYPAGISNQSGKTREKNYSRIKGSLDHD